MRGDLLVLVGGRPRRRGRHARSRRLTSSSTSRCSPASPRPSGSGPPGPATGWDAPGGDDQPFVYAGHAGRPRPRRRPGPRDGGTKRDRPDGRLARRDRARSAPRSSSRSRDSSSVVRDVRGEPLRRLGGAPRPQRAADGCRGSSPAIALAMAMLPEEFPVVLTRLHGARRVAHLRRAACSHDGCRRSRRSARRRCCAPTRRARSPRTGCASCSSGRRSLAARGDRRARSRGAPRHRRARSPREPARSLRSDGVRRSTGSARPRSAPRRARARTLGRCCGSTRSRRSCSRSRTSGARLSAGPLVVAAKGAPEAIARAVSPGRGRSGGGR